MKKWGYLVAVLVGAALLLGGTTGFAKSLIQKISARFANIQLIVNDQAVNTKAEPFIYNGNVYAPVAAVANALGIQQEWDNSVPAVRFSQSPLHGIDKESGCRYSSMGKDSIFLIACGRGADRPDGFYLDDHGKRFRFPFTGETIIESVSPFLSLVDPGKTDDLLVVERDTRNYSMVYLTAYRYHDGEFTKLDSFHNGSTASDRRMHTEILLGGDGGYTVYLQESTGGGSDLRISTIMYQWDKDIRKYVKRAETP